MYCWTYISSNEATSFTCEGSFSFDPHLVAYLPRLQQSDTFKFFVLMLASPSTYSGPVCSSPLAYAASSFFQKRCVLLLLVLRTSTALHMKMPRISKTDNFCNILEPVAVPRVFYLY